MKTQHAVKVVEAARELLKCYGYFVDNLWHIGDVHFLCEQQNLARLDDEEAMCVLAIANEQFDGEMGLSWPQLERALRSYIKRRDMAGHAPRPRAKPHS